MQIKFMSWNVNGLRSLCQKDSWQEILQRDLDFLGLQEVRAMPEQLDSSVVAPTGWTATFNPCQVKKGYSGVAIYAKKPALNISYDLPDPQWQGEGRLIHFELEKIHFLNGYFPNGGSEILDDNGKSTGNFKRLDYKMGFFAAFANYVQELRKTKPVVVCGDFNIAHQAIDLARPKQNQNQTGFLQVERDFLDYFTNLGYIDSFRHLNPDLANQYTWWSYKTQARAKNIGWRIDYFFISQELLPNLAEAKIESQIFGSDHCPVSLTLKF